MLWRAEALQRAPGFDPAGLMGAALFYDAQVGISQRLVLEYVLCHDNEAVIVSYAQVEEFIAADGICSGVKFRSRLDGRQSSALATVLINVTGRAVGLIKCFRL